MITATFSDEEAESIGFAAEELSAVSDIEYDDAVRVVADFVEAYR